MSGPTTTLEPLLDPPAPRRLGLAVGWLVALGLGAALIVDARTQPTASPAPATASASSPASRPATRPPWGSTDFLQFYSAARLIHAGQNPYDSAQTAAIQAPLGRPTDPLLTYAAPTVLLLYAPLGRLSLPAAVAVHLALAAAALLACTLWWVTRLLPGRPVPATAAAALGVLWLPTLAVLGMGQTTWWVLLAATGWAALLNAGRPAAAGAVLALALVKPHIAAVLVLAALVLAVARRQWRTPLAFAVTVAAWVVLSALLLPAAWGQFWHRITAEHAPDSYGHAATLAGLLRATFGPSTVPLGWAASVAVALATAWLAGLQSGTRPDRQGGTAAERRGAPSLDPVLTRGASLETEPCRPGASNSPERLLLLVLAATLCATPHAFSYDWVLLLPAVLWSAAVALARPGLLAAGPLAAMLALNAWLIHGRGLHRLEVHDWWVPWAVLAVLLAALPLRTGRVPAA